MVAVSSSKLPFGWRNDNNPRRLDIVKFGRIGSISPWMVLPAALFLASLYISLATDTTTMVDNLSFFPVRSSQGNTNVRWIVVAPTFYTSQNEVRYELGVEACRSAARREIRLLLVDGSPADEIRRGLEEAGLADGKRWVRVVRQSASGKKGAALREAIRLAHDEVANGTTTSTTQRAQANKKTAVIAFQELEKVDMFRHWPAVVQHMLDSGSDIAVPARAVESFRDYYPIEQFHSETFGNMYLDSLGKQIGLPPIDWTMGPVAFRSSQTHHWTSFDGELWDAQLVPLVRAYHAGAKVTSFEVDYHHPKAMKEQEQGIAAWNEKRLMQLNFLKDTVGKDLIALQAAATTKEGQKT